MAPTITEATAQQLVDELVKREGCSKIDVGPYKGYRIKPKYRKDRTPIDFDGVAILIEDSAIPDSSSMRA